MNQKEINELKRRFRPDKTGIRHIYGCYVNTQHEIISRIDVSLAAIPEQECELYLDRLKKVFSGAPGKNSIEIVFTPEQVGDSDEHRLLMALRDSRLEDPEIREEFFQKVIESLEPEEQNYLLLLGCDSYDVPKKGRDGETDADGSDQVFTYVVCAICPVKDGGANLRYVHEEQMFRISGTGQLAAATELGFVFPAFDGRATNINNALYFSKQPGDLHPELIDALFRTEAPMTAPEQREVFHGALSDSLGEDFHYDTLQTVHELLRERIQEHREEKDPEPLELSLREMSAVLERSGVSEEHREAFQSACKERFGDRAVLHPENLIESGRFEVVTPEVKLLVDPEYSYMIETRVIDGRKYLLIPADQGVEINGVPVSVHTPEKPEEEPAQQEA